MRNAGENAGAAALFTTEALAALEERMRPVLLWALGIPIPIIILLYVFHVI